MKTKHPKGPVRLHSSTNGRKPSILKKVKKTAKGGKMKHEKAEKDEKEPVGKEYPAKVETKKVEVKPEVPGTQGVITADELSRRLKADKKLIVLDVFGTERPQAWNIEGSERIAFDKLKERFKDAEHGDVVVYSSENSTSEVDRASNLLMGMGLNVLAYRGDANDWSRASMQQQPVKA